MNLSQQKERKTLTSLKPWNMKKVRKQIKRVGMHIKVSSDLISFYSYELDPFSASVHVKFSISFTENGALLVKQCLIRHSVVASFQNNTFKDHFARKMLCCEYHETGIQGNEQWFYNQQTESKDPTRNFDYHVQWKEGLKNRKYLTTILLDVFNNITGKFNWKGTIKAILSQAPDNEISIKKLRKKVQ